MYGEVQKQQTEIKLWLHVNCMNLLHLLINNFTACTMGRSTDKTALPSTPYATSYALYINYIVMSALNSTYIWRHLAGADGFLRGCCWMSSVVTPSAGVTRC